MTYVPPHTALTNFLLSLPTATLDFLADVDPTFGRLIVKDSVPIKLVGSGKRCITLGHGPGTNYSTHDVGSVVQTRLYADHTRDSIGHAPQEDGIDRAWAMFGVLDHLLHAADPLTDGALMLQCDRANMPLETFDQQLDTPYLLVTYDLAVHAAK